MTERVFVAGHRGLVGSAITRALEKKRPADQIITRSRKELDLSCQADVDAFFAEEKPDQVYMAAAKVGGIHANDTMPAEFIGENLKIQTNIIDASYRHGVKKFLFLGSSCIYPKLAEQPLKEEYLLTGPLESTNEWYAVAKIAGIKMVQAYRRQYAFNGISAMPTNLYGPGDNFDPMNSHVLPALIRRFHEAKENGAADVVVWGSGSPLREFLHVDDLAEACLFLMANYNDEQFINVGSGEEISIKGLAELIKDIVGFKGELKWDTSKPDGTPRKLMDNSRIKALGWEPKIDLASGIASVYEWYCQQL